MLLQICFFILIAVVHEINPFLVVPATSPTRHQFIVGLGVPLNLENEAITYGWTIKAQYFLPESTADDLKFVYFPGIFNNDSCYTCPNSKVKFAVNTVNQYVENQQHVFPNGRRRKRDILVDNDTGKFYEMYEQEAQEVGNENLKSDDDIFDDTFEKDARMNPKLSDYPKPNEEELDDLSGTRWLLYDTLGKMLEAKGFEGRHCILRAICESAETNFGYHSGLFGQLFHILFTPSSTEDKIVNKDHYDYIKAETMGKDGEHCDKIFYQCKRSIMEIFTQVYDSNLFKF